MKLNRAMHRAIALTVAAAFAMPAMAADSTATQEKGNPRFVKLDKNKDGFLSRDEVRGIRDYGKAFTEADDNKDGKLDQAEFIKAEAIHDRIAAGKYVDDSLLTAKVKAALLKEPELKSLAVSVESRDGEVLLSGFVRDQSQKAKAVKAAHAVAGVTVVRDKMEVQQN